MEWARYRCTDPSPNPQCNLQPPHSTAKAFFSAESKGAEKKANIWSCLLFPVSMRSWGIVFLKALVLVSIFKTTKRSHLLWKAKMLGHRGALGCSTRQKEDVLPGWSPIPQAFRKIQIITPPHLCEPWSPVRLGGYLEWDLAKSGLAVILDFLFSLQPTKFHQLSCPESSGIQLPFSIPSPRLPLHTPHCSSLPVVSVHPLILLLPFLTSPPQGSS